MKQRKWYHLTVKRRIFLGFSMMSLLLVVIGTMDLWGIRTYHRFFGEFSRLNEQANVQIDIDLTTKEIQRQVTRFMYEGHTSAGYAALEAMDALRARIRQARTDSPDVEALAHALDMIDRHLDVYQDSFRAAMEEMQVYNQLIKRDLPDMAEQLEQRLNALHAELILADVHDEGLLLLAKAQTSLLSYFEGFDGRKAREAAAYLQTLGEQIARYEWAATDPAHHERIREIDTLLDQYSRMTRRAVQATRGYLFFINVIMAAEATEIIHQARVLRKAGEEQKAALQAGINQLTGRMTLIIVLFTTIPMVAGILYAALVTRQITGPLSRITATFRELSEGKRVHHIPESNRLDEIGDLAQSANVFRRRNAETEDLLAKADSLARELQEKKAALEASNLEMEQFVYTVSHDLKSPIITSMGFIGIIRDLAAAGRHEEAVARLDRVEQANTRMGALINDLLELSRVGRMEMPMETLDMNALLRRLKASVDPACQSGGFTLEIARDLPAIHGNESRLLQVFENLVSNALKYGRGEPPHGNRVEISGSREPETERVVFRVRDYGPGIPEAYREKVFALFARLDPASSGTGIGLSIVRKLARQHGGDAWIESPEGPGVAFCVAFQDSGGKPDRGIG